MVAWFKSVQLKMVPEHTGRARCTCVREVAFDAIEVLNDLAPPSGGSTMKYTINDQNYGDIGMSSPSAGRTSAGRKGMSCVSWST